MRAIELGLHCPRNVNGITADPQPQWSFDNLLSELDSIDKKLNMSLDFPSPITKAQPRDLRASKDNRSCGRGFVMHVSDHESDSADGDSEEEADNSPMVSGTRFACDELYMSDDSEDGKPLGMQCHLMDKMGLEEVAPRELTHKLQLSVLEEVRSEVSSFEIELVNLSERFASSITNIDKYRELQQGRERKLDLQYRRTVAEALDNHLTAVWRDHEHMSQIDERKIRDGQTKRKEKAIQEEKLRQDRINAEGQARLNAQMAERAKEATIKAEKQAAEEAASKCASETLSTSHDAMEDFEEILGLSGPPFDVTKGNVIRASTNALELERRRRQIHEELSAKNKALKGTANQVYHGRDIGRIIRTISTKAENDSVEAVDNHLTAIRWDHEQMSKLEERRIRDDVACEEAKRKEKETLEEKLWQERIKAEAEGRPNAEMAKRAKAAAIEAEKQAAEEAASKCSSETLNTTHNAVEDFRETLEQSGSSFDVTKGVESSARNMIKASQNALELERRRMQIYEELYAKNKALKETTNQASHGWINIDIKIRTVSASTENVRMRADELKELMNNPGCPQSISILLFAEKIVSNKHRYQRTPGAIFAISRVIVRVTSKIPVAMDILIAELNKVCIYTVPKHINYSEESFGTKDVYSKAIGYKEENGKIESDDDYIESLSCCMKLYGALVQTEEKDSKNLHGLTEGWAWLARFLNTLPADLYTAVALSSFLEVAGYALYQRYRNQFEKLLRIIAHDFLNALQERKSLKNGDSQSWNEKLSTVKNLIRRYIELDQYKEEPAGLQLIDRIHSTRSVP